ncbi:hypothetical protein A2716_00745 [candidate division WWE3 bacterium RIFCSPHIGHO2_01_FULL_40_23]|uniref:Uncharacterized protein n=1 Tax=candidate division WWE3 bacterium RIFCSPLOWO2_01_FULL_41_18 TaxID=1802625 RepID=A0A1F4VE43_UNCKA|nr:MAG: hypothetical protein A2716_00745 [candidate division WWE3 bacterium RIFCSPHIGHO2_01_FULL_40_23]OGC55522.1 MAG: hypothetical protein A3A78_01015 [candidate division WWE3 bacterium RIFCSPLOWO2_01_FULL_41_18]
MNLIRKFGNISSLVRDQFGLIFGVCATLTMVLGVINLFLGPLGVLVESKVVDWTFAILEGVTALCLFVVLTGLLALGLDGGGSLRTGHILFLLCIALAFALSTVPPLSLYLGGEIEKEMRFIPVAQAVLFLVSLWILSLPRR